MTYCSVNPTLVPNRIVSREGYYDAGIMVDGFKFLEVISMGTWKLGVFVICGDNLKYKSTSRGSLQTNLNRCNRNAP